MFSVPGLWKVCSFPCTSHLVRPPFARIAEMYLYVLHRNTSSCLHALLLLFRYRQIRPRQRFLFWGTKATWDTGDHCTFSSSESPTPFDRSQSAGCFQFTFARHHVAYHASRRAFHSRRFTHTHTQTAILHCSPVWKQPTELHLRTQTFLKSQLRSKVQSARWDLSFSVVSWHFQTLCLGNVQLVQGLY